MPKNKHASERQPSCDIEIPEVPGFRENRFISFLSRVFSTIGIALPSCFFSFTMGEYFIFPLFLGMVGGEGEACVCVRGGRGWGSKEKTTWPEPRLVVQDR